MFNRQQMWKSWSKVIESESKEAQVIQCAMLLMQRYNEICFCFPCGSDVKLHPLKGASVLVRGGKIIFQCSVQYPVALLISLHKIVGKKVQNK